MPDYRAPGVYVEEVPSAVKPIAGVSTSTAAFIGVFDDTNILIPGDRITAEAVGPGDGSKIDFNLTRYPVITDARALAITVAGQPVLGGRLANDDGARRAKVTLATAPADKAAVAVDYVLATPTIRGEEVVAEWVGTGDKQNKEFRLSNYPVLAASDYTVKVAGAAIARNRAALKSDDDRKVATVTLSTAPDANEVITVDYVRLRPLALAGEVRLCTNFAEFMTSFGGFSVDLDQRKLAHAVYGFFNNGGTRCYVVRVAKARAVEDITSALAKLIAIDEIAIVAAPGITEPAVQLAIENHCRNLGDRFAILDGPESVTSAPTPQNLKPAFNSNYAAVYYPWLQVFDPVTKAMRPTGDGRMHVPPSGHVAGIYARVDAERGVHKAPANEVVMGALGVAYTISKADQAGLNPVGINCIRSINGNIQVWGARTLGGDRNADLKYVNVRRTLLFLRKSIEQGTQWVVFEPNGPELWQRITRNITAFLTMVWRSGALFGTTVAEAFYVRCDGETNPPEARDLGQVVTEIGVAIVRPAEFVIFRISQFTAPSA